jgi:putative methionine-R-sulfoxide reductase with GAF domain
MMPFILYTGQGSEEVAAKAFGVGIDDYLRKESEPAHYQVLARRIMYAVERTRTYIEVKSFERRLTALHEHSSQLSLAFSVEDVSIVTLDILEQVLGFCFASFQLVDSENLRVIGSRGHSASRTVSRLDEKGITNRVARTGTCALIPDIRCDPDYYCVTSQSLSELCVPVLSQGIVYAVLNIESDSVDAFSESDKQLMELLANHVASALNRLHSLEEESDQRKIYEHQLTALHTYSSKLNNAYSVEAISELTLEIAVNALGYKHASFHLLKDGVLYTIYTSDSTLLKMVFPIEGKGITARAARTGKTVLIRDTRLDLDYVQGEVATLSELAVPLIRDGEVLGVINVEHECVDAFTERDCMLVELLSVHSVSALTRIDLRDKEKEGREQYEKGLIKRTHQTASVLKAANKLNQASSLENVIDITLHTLKHDLAFEWAGFGVVENDLIIYKKINDVEIPLNASISLSRNTITTRAVNSRKTQLVKDVKLDPDYIVLSSDQSFRSELAVPILVRGEPKALINIEDKAVGRFLDNDQSLVELLAESVASALTRFEQSKIVEALHICGHSMIAVSSIEELSKVTFQTINDVLGFDYANLSLVEGENLVHRYSFGWDLVNTSLPLSGSGITVKAAITGEPQLINDVRLDPDYLPNSDEFTLSEIAVPVKIRDKVVAVLNIESKIENAFTDTDLAFMEVLVHNISSAIELIRSHELDLSSKQRQIDSLLVNIERHGLGIRQNLRSPLQSISNAAYLMMQRPNQSKSYFDVIMEGVSYCNEILEDLWVSVKAGDLVLQKVELRELLNLSLVSISGLDRVQVVRNTSDTVSLIVDEKWMSRVLHNLFQNAVDAMPESGVLTVSDEFSSSEFIITIRDSGLGISKCDMAELFTPFFTTKINGVGLGLSLCKQVVEAHGGSIVVESEEMNGCNVEIHLPISAVDESLVGFLDIADSKTRLPTRKK